MRNARLLVAAGIAGLLLLTAGVVFAGPLDAPGAAKALTCSACHGAAGNSQSETMPVIAGIAPTYFKKAIEDYASGKRVSPEMEPYAKMVRELGVDEVGAFFSTQKKQPSPGKVDSAAAGRGKAASAQCAACHGENGKGDPAKGAPDITGQPVGYLRNQLTQFKADRRSPGDEPLKAMKGMIKGIPDETLADLAAYYSSLK